MHSGCSLRLSVSHLSHARNAARTSATSGLRLQKRILSITPPFVLPLSVKTLGTQEIQSVAVTLKRPCKLTYYDGATQDRPGGSVLGGGPGELAAIQAHLGREVQLRFCLQGAELFSWWFEPQPPQGY